MNYEKKYLNKRVDIRCDCGKKRPINNRIKFGTCSCDTYNMDYTLAIVISNYLYQYLASAKPRIIREDWEKIEKCADSIKKFAYVDSFDELSEDKEVKDKYFLDVKNFKESMDWLVDNWHSFWW